MVGLSRACGLNGRCSCGLVENVVMVVLLKAVVVTLDVRAVAVTMVDALTVDPAILGIAS
jgi:hypothetical protein